MVALNRELWGTDTIENQVGFSNVAYSLAGARWDNN
jgi:hypothetical protein